MLRRAAMLVLVPVAIVVMVWSAPASGEPPTPYQPLDNSAFHRVSRVSEDPPTVILTAVPDFPTGAPEHTRASAVQPPASLGAIAKAPLGNPTPSPSPAAPPKLGVSGTASWYDTWYMTATSVVAAAGPALRVGNWRGRTVTVCRAGVCVRPKIVDFCQCYGSRLIDLSPAAFRALAPLSQGVISVTVSW